MSFVNLQIVVLFVGPSLVMQPSDRAEEARFTTSDGVEIVGDFHAPDAAGPFPVVILLHQYQSDRTSWKPLIPVLNKAGLAALAIDLRGYGDSTQPSHMQLSEKVRNRDPEHFAAIHLDVAAAYCWLAQRPEVDLSRFGLVGASVGCSVALDYAGRNRSVDAVVCMTPGENYLGLNSLSHIQKLRDQSVLLLATEKERKASDRLGDLYPEAKVDIVGPGQVHGTRMFGKIAGIEQLIADFLKDALGPVTTHHVVVRVGDHRAYNDGSARALKIDPCEGRWFSSAEEAKARGYEVPETVFEGVLDDTATRNESLLQRPLREKGPPLTPKPSPLINP